VIENIHKDNLVEGFKKNKMTDFVTKPWKSYKKKQKIKRKQKKKAKQKKEVIL